MAFIVHQARIPALPIHLSLLPSPEPRPSLLYGSSRSYTYRIYMHKQKYRNNRRRDIIKALMTTVDRIESMQSERFGACEMRVCARTTLRDNYQIK